MKNNKGMTLVEIIISIALISIVLLFLFMLLITVNDINDESEVNSSYLINKSLILKNIEEDLSKSNSITLSTCNVKDDIYGNYGVSSTYFTDKDNNSKDNLKANRCIKIKYNDITDTDDENIAKIGIYYYKNKSSYVISYIRGNIKATRLLTDFEKYNVTVNESDHTADLKNDFKIVLGNTGNSCGSNLSGCTTSSDIFSKITIPIIGPDEKDYSILISYYGTVTIE